MITTQIVQLYTKNGHVLACNRGAYVLLAIIVSGDPANTEHAVILIQDSGWEGGGGHVLFAIIVSGDPANTEHAVILIQDSGWEGGGHVLLAIIVSGDPANTEHAVILIQDSGSFSMGGRGGGGSNIFKDTELNFKHTTYFEPFGTD